MLQLEWRRLSRLLCLFDKRHEMANNVTSLFIEKCAACKFAPPTTTALFFLCAIFQFSRLRQLFAVIAHISYIECAGKKIGQALKTRRRTHTCVFARDRGVCVCHVLAPRVCVTFILWPLMMRALWESQKRLNKEILAPGHPRQLGDKAVTPTKTPSPLGQHPHPVSQAHRNL